jgi:poly(A) polymerase
MTRIDQDWLRADETQAVMGVLSKAGHQAWVVGGCVRDALLHRMVSDIDIATDAVPEVVLDLAAAAGMSAVPTGIDHGTVTVVAGGRGFEVTTFRRDVATDGRRAVVRFADTMGEDAARRDFTINALYADPGGRVEDPLGQGLDDLAARRVRFIGNAAARIAEDYLRILRYFRFSAWYADPESAFDPDTLATIGANLGGLDKVSAERVTHELLRLLAAPDPGAAVAAMESCGVLGRVLPEAVARAMPGLMRAEAQVSVRPAGARRLAALGGDLSGLRLSRKDAAKIRLLRGLAAKDVSEAEISWRDGASVARDVAALRAARGRAIPPDLEAAIDAGQAADFPVAAADLMPEYEGPALGARLAELERAWIDSGFRLGRDALLAL